MYATTTSKLRTTITFDGVTQNTACKRVRKWVIERMNEWLTEWVNEKYINLIYHSTQH